MLCAQSSLYCTFFTFCVSCTFYNKYIAELFDVLYANITLPAKRTILLLNTNLQQQFQASYDSYVGSVFNAVSVINVKYWCTDIAIRDLSRGYSRWV